MKPITEINTVFARLCSKYFAMDVFQTNRKGITFFLKRNSRACLLAVALLLSLLLPETVPAQEKVQMVRLAKLVIDSAQLDAYKAALKEEIEASVRLEPGVLTLYAVSEKNNPTR